MAASIQWQIGTIRFGVEHRSADRYDPYSGQALVVRGMGKTCVISNLLSVEEMLPEDRDAILEQCERAGFDQAYIERVIRTASEIKVLRFRYDLTSRPYKRARV